MRRSQVAHIDELVRAAGGESCGRDAIIQDSWRRCVNEHKLDPVVLRDPHILPSTRLREHQDAMDEFLHTARFGVETLYREVAGLHYVLLLTDAKGVTVDFIGDPTFDNNLMRAGLYLGADWNEPHAGTCAVGTCIATGEALVVHQTDHFDATHIPLTCTAAPIFDPSGRLAAVLDISALRSPEPKESQFLALQLVKSFAHKIETAHLIHRFRREWILRLAASPEFADIDPTHVLAVDGSGTILGFNNRARLMLLAEARQRGTGTGTGTDRRPLVGRRISEFFDIGVDDLPRLGHGRPASQRMIRLAASGTPLFAHTLAPPSKRAASQAAVAPPTPLAHLHGGDEAMALVAKRAAKLVDSRMSLLISGETGTGKEHLAKAIHASGARARKPFVPVNCAALPETLIEGELFGYEPGAFTGAASKGKKGLVLEADGGTLFLDEIGDMPLPLQTRLLRVLAEREVTPIGRTRPVPVDIRVVAATHRDLIAEVRAGRFREDLYFRLSAAVLTLPPLRLRRDRAWLVDRMFADRCRAAGVELELSSEARAALCAYAWPGNIRELQNALDYTCAVAGDGIAGLDDLPDIVREAVDGGDVDVDGGIEHGWAPAPSFASHGPGQAAQSRPNPWRGPEPSPVWPDFDWAATGGHAAERESLIAALAARRWNVSAVARDLALDRTTVHRRMRRLGIVPHRSGG